MKRLFALLALGLIAPTMMVGCTEEKPADTPKPAVEKPADEKPVDAPK